MTPVALGVRLEALVDALGLPAVQQVARKCPHVLNMVRKGAGLQASLVWTGTRIHPMAYCSGLSLNVPGITALHCS